MGNLYSTGAIAGTVFDNSVRRFASSPGTNSPLAGAVPGISNELNSDFNARAVSGRVEAGYRLTCGQAHMTLFGAFEAASWSAESFDRNGGLLGLHVRAKTVTSVPTFLGLQLDTRWEFGNGMSVDPWVRAAWQHEFAEHQTRPSGSSPAQARAWT